MTKNSGTAPQSTTTAGSAFSSLEDPQGLGDHRDGDHWDVVVIGGGLAGLTLARHLLLETDKRVLLIEKRDPLPQKRQKVGESSVQLAGWYFSKVLGMEAYLMHEHFMKYNLRFYWRSGGTDNGDLEDYSASYIRNFSNIPSYQLNRNTFEAELQRLNREDDRFQILLGVPKTDVQLGRGEEHHRLSLELDGETTEMFADWVIDTTGRRRLLAKKRDLRKKGPVRHGAFFWWVDGLVNIEELTELSLSERRKHPSRREVGHLPQWLATNHFCDEGLWFWVIPLQGRTSLGLVFDHQVVSWRDVFNVEKATEFVCRRFPLFARDLPQREVLDFGGLKDFSFDCVQTLSADRWALAGEAGRFSDPLYSPGSDLIAIYNTLIVDAVKTEETDELRRKCQTYESMMKAVFQAYLPSYAVSYDSLGDQECFSLKYTWELSIYFAVYVFPFINDLLTDRRFTIGFLRQFARLGPWNRTVQDALSQLFQWKKTHRLPVDGPRFMDFMEIETLCRAEKTFYEVGLEAPEAKRILATQVDGLEELARFITAYAASVMLGRPQMLRHPEFVEGLDVESGSFDLDALDRLWRDLGPSTEEYRWSLDPQVLDRFHSELVADEAEKAS